jgi:CxxC motif-containing protein (DUF1111 family)
LKPRVVSFRNAILLGLVVSAALLACSRAQRDGTAVDPGAPLPDLSPDELAAFATGRALFDRDFTTEQGLGPAFNERRCSSCHDLPTVGGMGGEVVQKVARFEHGHCDLLLESGGDLLQQQVTDTLRALGFGRELIPRGANAIATIVPPALYGLGLVEAIPDDAILAHADAEDRDGDGISGRPAHMADGRLGRFGRKAGFATIREFVEDALLREMGITSVALPEELRPGGRPLPPGVDPAADPELPEDSITAITTFVQLLAAPAPAAPARSAGRDSIERGARIFRRIGCAGCHTPAFRTRSEVAALDARTVRLYSDLLLHDMGPGRASVCAPNAAPSEWRTPPLMGLRHRHSFLHDGQAQSVNSAIEAHGGEAQGSRALFRRLPPNEQSLLLRFVYSL